jgi:hypothetical protein
VDDVVGESDSLAGVLEEIKAVSDTVWWWRGDKSGARYCLVVARR